jgi:hypothetical protein
MARLRVGSGDGWSGTFGGIFFFSGLTEHIKIDRTDYSYGIYLNHMLVVSTFIALGIIGHCGSGPSFMSALSLWRKRCFQATSLMSCAAG